MKLKSNNIQDQSRRDFFVKIALASLATTLPLGLLSGCKEEIKYTGTGKVPYKVWEEMLEAIKTSPDYLPQRVEDLIATKDPKAMYDFVKNEIILMPTTKNAISYYDLGNGLKWGIEGVLRCGMATPREKVELLHHMYQKAGIESKVVYEYTAIKNIDVPSFFYRPLQREFNPKISKSQLKQWEKEMGSSGDTETTKELVVDYTKDANALADKIIKSLPNIDDFGDKFNFKWDNSSTPTLEFVWNEKTQYAHLFDPKTPFGEKHNSSEGQIIEAKPIKENTEKVNLKITYRDTVDYNKEKELINGEWNAIDLIGKQIQFNFLNGLTFEEQMVTPIGNLRTFTPVLALQAINNDLEFAEKRSFIADPITIDGKRIPISQGNNIAANGNEILAKPDPQLQKKVQNMTVVPQVSGYPIVKLNIDATDASGKLIEGLSASDFKITDNGKPIKALLENNQRTPKILILSDGSGSMPASYKNEGIEKFNSTLKEKIKEKYPAAILEFWRTSSSLFTWLLKASQTDYDLILFATDGDNRDDFDQKNTPIYKAGPPAIILNVYNDDSGYGMVSFNKMAEATNGIVLNAENQENVIEELTGYIESMKLAPYVFTYASADKSKPHTVAVTIDNERIKANSDYAYPKVKLEKKNGIVGVYLELKIGNKSPIKRVLAGWDPVVDYYNEPKTKEVDAVQQLLLGGVLLAIEGEGPTLAVALADLLKSKLSNRKWGEAYLDNDFGKAKDELNKGSHNFPAILIPMLAPLQEQNTSTSLTYANGYRMCLLKTLMPINDEGTFTFDYLPTSDYQTLAKDKQTRFITTIKKTAQLAVREGTIFTQSSYTALQKATLIERAVASKESWFKNHIKNENKDYSYWSEKVIRGVSGYTTIFDRSANSKSFWSLGFWSGELYGIMPDGSGGGGDMFKKQLDDLNRVLDMYKAIASIAGVGNLPLSIVATYGKTLAKLYAIASEAIIIMDTTGMDEELKKAMAQLACNVAKDINDAFTSLPGAAGQIQAGLQLLINGMSGDNSGSC